MKAIFFDANGVIYYLHEKTLGLLREKTQSRLSIYEKLWTVTALFCLN